jgi:Astacin (Peptidase family M12A)/IPT/TIG domain/Abnormal spindle-like microcephaly-assoc'd, ASPM-SPD-2-Hydin/Divergent InlB B-repeat domain
MAQVVRRFVSAIILLTFSLTVNAQTARPTGQLPPRHIPTNTIGQTGSGIYRGHRVNYVVVDGRMMFDGDIVLDHVDQKIPTVNNFGATIDYLQFRWPLVGSVYQIPYMIDPASGDVANINTAISTYNSLLAGVIQWVPLTTQTDYVDFDLTDASGSGEGFSNIGRSGGKQIIGGATNCTVGTLLHEMGHATGFWHEQSRPDRDKYVTMNFNNMVTTTYQYSEIQIDDMQPLTLYDWSSIMEYFPDNFTKNGQPVIESIPAGMPLANFVGYSAGDIDAIKRLYGAAPTEVTIATNPAGLQVVVDGTTITTPQTFNWPLFSTHTLSVASGVQTQTGNIVGTTTSTTFYYTYGRWNDNGAQTHTVTVLPGNNELAFPATSPAVTAYMASFIQLVPYTSTVSPPGAGTVVPSPAPQSYTGASGVFYIARQPVTLTATPSTGQNFYQYISSPYWQEGGLSANPKSFLAPDTGNPINMTTYFTPTSSPTFTFDSNPDGAQFYVILDGSYWPAPINFSPYYDTSWAAGTNHTIAVPNPEYPWTLNTRYAFVSWNDGGTVSHNITMPSTSTNYRATLQPQYFLSDYANEPCAGSVAVMPSSPTGDGYYDGATPLTFTATANTGWDFTEWQQNLSGTTNPLNVTMNDELTGIADFSTIPTPLTVTSISPVAAVAGSAGFNLTINGTGFTGAPNPTVVFVANSFVANTFVNQNQITVPISAKTLATPGGIQVFVENFPSGATCAAFAAVPFNIAHAPIVTPNPINVTYAAQLVGTTSATKTINFKNTSATAVSINSITASGDFAITGNSCKASLAAGASCNVVMTFTPTVAGGISGALAMSDSAPDSPQVVSLKGTGSLPLTITPATLSFGTTTVGTTTAAQKITVTNNESTALAFSSAASGNFAISPTGTTCTGSLASKASCILEITFSPTTAGAIIGSVALSDSTTYSPQLVSLSGTGSGGITPPLTFTPYPYTFANQVAGTTSAGKTINVKNTSASALTLTSLAASGAFTVVGNGTTPCTAGSNLAAGASCTMSVTFTPALGTVGGVEGSILITDNASVSQQIMELKGTAALPLSLSPATLTFPAQTVATTSTAQTVTVLNNLPTAVTPTIAANGEFTVVPGGATPCSGSLASHAKCTFTVTFTPSAIGIRSGAVTFTDSANPGLQTLSLTGTGQ